MKDRRFGIASGWHSVVKKKVYKPKTCLAVRRSKGHKLLLKIYRQKALKRAVQVAQGPKDNFEGTSYRVWWKKDLKMIISKVTSTSVSGYRFINMNSLNEHYSIVAKHMCSCSEAKILAASGSDPVSVLQETNNFGLAVTLKSKCNGCQAVFSMSTSPRINIDGTNHYDMNVRAVWGSMVSGNGSANLNEMLATMDSPGMNSKTFSKIESEIGKWWHSALEIEMLLAGEEERRLAIECNSYHQDVPAITVIVDGGWSKRTHKHSYNAPGGVGIIIGQKTGKILHIGVRNKYCSICRQAETKNILPKQHECFKNWTESSQSMEKDVILEGFLCAEKKHGLRYTKVVADGDSSVFASIQEHVPVWGKYVEKIECSNHVCKCLRSSLEKLVTENANYRGKHRLTKQIRIKIVSAVRCAIRLRSAIDDKKKATKLLRHDIMNSVHHIFGNHSRCTDFCKAKKDDVDIVTLDDEEVLNDDGLEHVLNGQVSYWSEGTSLQHQEDARKATDLIYSDLSQQMLSDVSLLLSRVAAKSDRLIQNTTTNLAECWMHVRSKFDGGKVTNRTQRGSWHARCYGAAVRQIKGPQWSPKLWTQVTGTPAGSNFKKIYRQRAYDLHNSKINMKSKQQQQNRWKRRMTTSTKSNSKKARLDYGPDATDVVADVSAQQLNVQKTNYVDMHINIDEEKIKNIEQSTTAQSQSGLWISERKKRITASNFGKIIKRNTKLKVEPLVRELLYSSFKGNRHTLKGLQEERTTIQEYILHKASADGVNVTVHPVGLCISREDKFLAASPDGIVRENGEEGILEVKNLLHNKPISLRAATKCEKNFCLELVDEKIQLNIKHPYYFQCQGEMGVTGLKWCDFVVRTTNPYQIHVERILFDIHLWNNYIRVKLFHFYHSALLPELANQRYGKYPGIREPGNWFVDDPCLWQTNRKTAVLKTNPKLHPLPIRKEAQTSISTTCNRNDNVNKLSLCKKRQKRIDAQTSNSITCSKNDSVSVNRLNKPSLLKERLDRDGRHTLTNVASIATPHLNESIQETSYSKKLDTSNKPKQNITTKDINNNDAANSTECKSRERSKKNRRSVRRKFLARTIKHQWKTDKGKNKWYEGYVQSLLSGQDGEDSAKYLIQYSNYSELYEVEGLVEDYEKGLLKFVDL